MDLAGDGRPRENPKRASSRDGARISLLNGFQSSAGLKSDERRLEVMKIHTFVIGSVLAVALFLFAQTAAGDDPAG